jgi:hypothetical protein
MMMSAAKRLKPGDRVRWSYEGDVSDGTVAEVGYCAVKVRWDDGVVSTYQFDGDGTAGVAFLFHT